jgi:hypothetical protein
MLKKNIVALLRKRGGGGATGSVKKLSVCLFVFVLLATGCEHRASDPVWLADLTNPFIGKWESDIPSANMHLVFDYKTDGTFDYEIPGMPAEQGGKGSGGYLVTGNVMVSYLSFEGAAGYTFKVIDNDTIDVTEIEEIKADGSFVLGNTAPFTRVAGSTVNKENKPFVLTHPYIGKWHFEIHDMEVPEYGPGEHDVVSNYVVRADGTVTYDYKLDNYPPMEGTFSYFFFDNRLVIYQPDDGIEIGIITPAPNDPNTIYMAEEGEDPVPLTRVP